MHSAAISRARDALLGLSVGDAFGACVTADPTFLQERSLPIGPWRWTDDTEMACSVVAVLDRSGLIDRDELAASFAEHYDQYRDYGPGTNRILRRMRRHGEGWRELAARAGGGHGSRGNGAAMRVAPLGAYFADDLDRAVREAAASAEVTHAHPEGVAGAIAVAVAAALAASDPSLRGGALLEAVAARTPAGAVGDGILYARDLVDATDPAVAAAALGNGSAISAADTVPFCLWIVAAGPAEFASACWSAAGVGGDGDTLCAIVGGVLGVRLGSRGIPETWRSRREPLPLWAGS